MIDGIKKEVENKTENNSNEYKLIKSLRLNKKLQEKIEFEREVNKDSFFFTFSLLIFFSFSILFF